MSDDNSSSKKELKAIRKEKIKELKDRQKTALMKIGGIFVIATLVALGFFFFAKTVNTAKNKSQAASLVNIVTYKDQSKGSENPKTEIIVYSNFICDDCAKIQDFLKQAELEFQSKIRIVFRHFYENDDKKSAFIAKFAETAGLQNKFWEASDELLKNGKNLKETENITPLLTLISKNIGLNIDAINENIGNAEISEKILRDITSASSTSVSENPSIFIKNIKIGLPKNYEELKTVIEKSLEEKVE